MVIVTPSGKTIKIFHKDEIALEKINTLNAEIESLSVVTMTNLYYAIGTSLLAVTGITMAVVSNVHTKKLSKKIANMEAEESKKEE